MVPESAHPDVVWQHLYRYRFATQFCLDRDVLDVACGEGYGAAALAAARSRSVIAVDVDAAVCDHARRRYGGYGIQIREGDATRLPLKDQSVDLVVSFETVEHVPVPVAFVDECRRVLRPGGRLIMSTPNVEVYNPERRADHNEYHCSEMTAVEFTSLLAERFGRTDLYVQVPTAIPRWHPRRIVARLLNWGRRHGFAGSANIAETFAARAEARARTNPVGTILATEPWASRLVNPLQVRRPFMGLDEKPVYLIAVARFPRPA